jgi:hypothetical protein
MLKSGNFSCFGRLISQQWVGQFAYFKIGFHTIFQCLSGLALEIDPNAQVKPVGFFID